MDDASSDQLTKIERPAAWGGPAINVPVRSRERGAIGVGMLSTSAPSPSPEAGTPPGITGKAVDRFYTKLKRRSVFRVGTAYIVAAWLAAQVADVVSDGLGAPEWVMKAVLLALALGWPIALIVSWFVEVTPKGLKLESEIENLPNFRRHQARLVDLFVIACLTVAVALLLVHRSTPNCLSGALEGDSAASGLESPDSPENAGSFFSEGNQML